MKKLVVLLAALALLISVGVKSTPAIHAAPASAQTPKVALHGACTHWAEETWSGWHWATSQIEQATELWLELDASNNYCGYAQSREFWNPTVDLGHVIGEHTYTYVNGSYSIYNDNYQTNIGCNDVCPAEADGPIQAFADGTTVYYATYGTSGAYGFTNFGTGTGWYTIP